VANQPQIVKSVLWGQQLRFTREQITDWAIEKMAPSRQFPPLRAVPMHACRASEVLPQPAWLWLQVTTKAETRHVSGHYTLVGWVHTPRSYPQAQCGAVYSIAQ